jgi:hypothetical protein
MPLRGPRLAHVVVCLQLLHLVESGGGEVLDDEAVEAVRIGAPSGGQGLLKRKTAVWKDLWVSLRMRGGGREPLFCP